jgi:membrane protease YdiL (CAAX protease family)
VLPEGWPVLALSILLLNGIAEETIYRGYLFRHLQERFPFGRAGACADHPLGGWAIGLIAVLVADMRRWPVVG